MVDGRARRVYRTTEAGRAALAQDRVALIELASEVLGPDIMRTPPARDRDADQHAHRI